MFIFVDTDKKKYLIVQLRNRILLCLKLLNLRFKIFFQELRESERSKGGFVCFFVVLFFSTTSDQQAGWRSQAACCCFIGGNNRKWAIQYAANEANKKKNLGGTIIIIITITGYYYNNKPGVFVEVFKVAKLRLKSGSS